MSKKVTPVEPEDEHAGMGGSYVVNASGVRELVARTVPAEDQPVTEQNNGTAEA